MYLKFYDRFRTESVYWAGFPILRAHLNCLEDVSTEDRDWQYWINLSAQDFPLKTNEELVQLLQSWRGANNMEVLVDKHTERLLHLRLVFATQNHFDENLQESCKQFIYV